MDPVIDMLIRMKNGQASHKDQISVPYSSMKWAIAKVLKDADFIQDVEKKSKKTKKSEHDNIHITLKYSEKDAGINDVKIISKPSRRIYVRASGIKPVRSGFGIAVLSTPKGIMSSKEAKKEHVGGELLFEIW